jgi:hypothetical protein
VDIPTPNLPGRALTPEQKRAIIERVLVAWERRPQLRLGQLVNNVIAQATQHASAEKVVQKLYFIEDQALVELLERSP